MTEQNTQAPDELALEAVELLLSAHRRFHGKVGCPGGADCYVCCAEAVYARQLALNPQRGEGSEET